MTRYDAFIELLDRIDWFGSEGGIPAEAQAACRQFIDILKADSKNLATFMVIASAAVAVDPMAVRLLLQTASEMAAQDGRPFDYKVNHKVVPPPDEVKH